MRFSNVSRKVLRGIGVYGPVSCLGLYVNSCMRGGWNGRISLFMTGIQSDEYDIFGFIDLEKITKNIYSKIKRENHQIYDVG